MRILLVCQNDFGAPTEKQALGFALELARRGHEVRITLGRDDVGLEALGAVDVSAVEIGHHGFAGPRLRAADRAAARAFAPDVIHAFNSRVPVVAAAADLRRATGAPVFVHFEDDEWRPPPGLPGESPIRPLGRLGRRVISRAHPPAWLHSARRSLGWVRREAVAFDALTPALAREVSARLGRPCAVVHPVSPPTREAPDAPAPLPADLAGRPVALFTGSVLPIYRDDVLLGLRGVAEARRRGHDLVFVHAGPLHARIRAEDLLAESGLDTGSAAFLGAVPFDRIAGMLRAATVLLQPGHPSEFNRLRLPAKLQEYLASGTPTLTFAVGFGELLADRDEALLTRSGDPAELADRIIELLTDDGLRRTLARGGPAAARRLFDPVTNVDALLAHYEAHVGPQAQSTSTR